MHSMPLWRSTRAIAVFLIITVAFGNTASVFAASESAPIQAISAVKIRNIEKKQVNSESNDTLSRLLAAPRLGPEDLAYIENQIIVKYKENRIDLQTPYGQGKALAITVGKSLQKTEVLKNINTELLTIKDGKTVEQKIAELKNDANVEYAEPNYKLRLTDISTDDTYRGLLWGLDNTGQTVNGGYSAIVEDPSADTGTADADIDAPEAWSITDAVTPAPVVVAVIDTGVAYNHQDLTANMWNGSNCKNENGNPIVGGCQHGYDFVDNDTVPMPTGLWHGTHVSGIIAALKGNGRGVIGVAPHVKIMAIKFGLDIASEVRAIDFARENGAKIINASFGRYYFVSQSELDALNRFRDAGGIVVAAAGNDNSNNDNYHFYPADYDLDNIIAVAATDQKDGIAIFSNYGATSVDVGAPGTNIYNVTAEPPMLLFSENFDTVSVPSLPAGWTGEGQNNGWGTHPDVFVGNILYGDLSSPYANDADASVTTPEIDLGGNTGAAYLSFNTWCDTEYTPNSWSDYMQLEFSADGVNFSSPFGSDFRWDEAAIDELNGDHGADGNAYFYFSNLPVRDHFLTSNFRMRWRWVTDGQNNRYNGCSVDDILVVKFGDGSTEQYGFSHGTSMAAPHVAGLAALLEGYNPTLTPAQVKDIILTTGDYLPTLAGKTVSGNRINAHRAIQAASPAKAITDFNLSVPPVYGVIDETAHTVTLTVPFGTDVTALIPIITINGATIIPANGLAQDFTNPVTYTVTAADGSTQAYIVTVVVTTSSNLTALTSAIARAQSLYDNAVEGMLPGQYRPPRKADLLSAIHTASLITGVDTQAVVDAALTNLNNTIFDFISSANPGDTMPPVITLNGLSNIILNVGDTYTELGAEALDAIYGIIPVAITGTVDTSAVGNYTVTYTATDGSGNTATVTRNVVVVATPITLVSIAINTLPNKLVYTVGEALDLTGLSVMGTDSDGVVRPVSVTVADVTGFDSTAPVTGQVLTITINGKTATFTIDVAAPSSNLMILTAAIAQAQNLYDSAAEGNLPGQYPAPLKANLFSAIQTALAITSADTQAVVDAAVATLNAAIATFSAGVVPADTVAPVITLNGAADMSLNVGEVYAELGATAIDAVYGTVAVTITGSVDTSVAGDYTITYTATDGSGNTATTTRTVRVVAPTPAPDTTAPVITLLGNGAINLHVGDAYNDAGATALDDRDGDITGRIVTVNPVNTAVVGDYAVTYNVSDTAGNAAVQITRTVNVATVPAPAPAPAPAPSSGGGGGGGGSASPAQYLAPIAPVNGFFIRINNNSAETSGREVTLALNGGTQAKTMAIANTTDFAGVSLEPYQESKSWILSDGSGVKTVYARFFGWNGIASPTITDDIVFVVQQPTAATAVAPTEGRVLGERITKIDDLIAALAPNKRDPRVKELQTELQRLGFFPKNFIVTDFYGKLTGAGVKKYADSQTTGKVMVTGQVLGEKIVSIDALVDALKPNKRDPKVRELQEELKRLGWFPANVKTTTFYGPITQGAVKKYLTAQQ